MVAAFINLVGSMHTHTGTHTHTRPLDNLITKIKGYFILNK